MEEKEKNKSESNQPKMDSKDQDNNRQIQDHNSKEVKNIGSFYISSNSSNVVIGNFVGGEVVGNVTDDATTVYRIVGSELDKIDVVGKKGTEPRNNQNEKSKNTEEKKED